MQRSLLPPLPHTHSLLYCRLLSLTSVSFSSASSTTSIRRHTTLVRQRNAAIGGRSSKEYRIKGRRNARWLTTTAGFTRSSPTITAAPSSLDLPPAIHNPHSESSTQIHPIRSYQSTDPTASPAQTALIHSVATPPNVTSIVRPEKHYLIILVIAIIPSVQPPVSRDST
ncbi:hypothetical protein FJTKL_02559 [Diaporthe vaccinii]|uniref:Secreted protein n=1 Tax=Diaporthe vaccinii TaxID=105482 RepID=A0ABR4DXX5_9PEZI